MEDVRRLPALVLLALATACASTPESDPLSQWSVVVLPLEIPVGSLGSGVISRAFSDDLVYELQSRWGVDARTPEAQEEAAGSHGNTLYLEAEIRPGSVRRLAVSLYSTVGDPPVWNKEYPVSSRNAVEDPAANLLRSVSRDVSAVVRAVERTPISEG